jgi:hypothetical protein
VSVLADGADGADGIFSPAHPGHPDLGLADPKLEALLPHRAGFPSRNADRNRRERLADPAEQSRRGTSTGVPVQAKPRVYLHTQQAPAVRI